MAKTFNTQIANTTAITFGDYLDLAQADGEGCTICGRKTGNNAKLVHLSIDAQVISWDYEGPESQGGWPVGNECAKKFVKGVLNK